MLQGVPFVELGRSDDVTPAQWNTCIYWLRDRERWDEHDRGDIAYIGITGNLTARMRNHAYKPWWPTIIRGTAWWYPSRVEAAADERELIFALMPRYNFEFTPAWEGRRR